MGSRSAAPSCTAKQPNGELVQAAKDLDYSYGDSPDLLVDVLELMLKRVDAQQDRLEGRDADRIAHLAERFHQVRQNCYEAPSALLALQREGRLTLDQAARYLNVRPIELARWAMPSAPEALIEFEPMLWAGDLTMGEIARRWGINKGTIVKYAASRGIKSRHVNGAKVSPAVHQRIAQLRRDGVSLDDIVTLLAEAGTPLCRSSVSKVGKAAGVTGVIGRVA